MSFVVICDGRVVTDASKSLRFSNVDPGGFEACSFDTPMGWPTPLPGARVRVFDGLTLLWEGRVEEPGGNADFGVAQQSVNAVGLGAAAKDNKYTMIYVDSDLGSWGESSTAQRLIVLNANRTLGSFSVVPDTSTGLPTIDMQLQAPWPSGGSTINSLYDAGDLCRVARVYYAFTAVGSYTDPSWYYRLAFFDADDYTSVVVGGTGNMQGQASGSGYASAEHPARYVDIEFTNTAVGSGDNDYHHKWYQMRTYGPHGLTLRGPDPGGLWPSDIARHALLYVPEIDPGVIADSSDYILSHSVYREPTDPEKVIDDMANLLGWHWGVWENVNLFNPRPRLDFRPRPDNATHSASLNDLSKVQFGQRLTDIYSRAIVSYTDTVGKKGYVTVTRPSILLPPGKERTLVLDLGTGSAAAARALGANALALRDASNRGVGSATIMNGVRTAGGTIVDAHTLRAGLHRLKITNPPSTTGMALGGDSRRYDTFRIQRVEVICTDAGPETRVELDGGADLLEVIQARLSIATNQVTG